MTSDRIGAHAAGFPYDREFALGLLADMLRIRRMEEKAAELYGAGKIRGFLHLYVGEEAVAVGALHALDRGDTVVGTYREHGHALIHGLSMNAIMAEMFPTRMRYAGVSLGYQVTSIVAGSLAPIIATALLSRYGSAVPIAVYLAVASVVTIIAVVAARETKGISLRDVDAADVRAVDAEKTAVPA